MIPLPEKILNDFSSSTIALEYLLEIHTDPAIYISSNKQIFDTSDIIITTEALGEELVATPFHEGWTEPFTINEDETITFEYDVHIKSLANNFEGGATYRVELYIEGTGQSPSGFNSHIFLTGGNSFNKVELHDGFNSFEVYVPDTIPEDGNIWLNYAYGTTMQSLSIKKIVYTQVVTEGTGIYYEDLDLKVSNISEKIDLKTKKVQYSDMTFTLSNFYQNEQYLSDRLSEAMGSNVNLYLKTQSCDELDDCLLIAKLKIRKIDHNNKVVNIVANDINLETLYVNLPKKTLESGVDTNEAGNLKPVPILYGHLEDAPAVLYIDSDETSYLIPDDSYFSNDKDIDGIKKWNKWRQYGYDSVYTYHRYWDHLVSPNALKVNLGNSMCDVPVKPYINSLYGYVAVNSFVENEQIRLFRESQYYTEHDYVLLNTSEAPHGDPAILSEYNAMWVSKVFDLRKRREFSYNYYEEGTHRRGAENQGVISGYLTTEAGAYAEAIESHRIAFEIFEFDSVSGTDVLDIKIKNTEGVEKNVFPVDVHFIGNMAIHSDPLALGSYEVDNLLRLRMNIIFSKIIDDLADPNHLYEGWGQGTPSEFTITNNSSVVSNNFDSRAWSTQKIDLKSHASTGGAGATGTQYISYLLSEWSENINNGGNYWKSVYISSEAVRKGMSSNTMAIIHSPHMIAGAESLGASPNTALGLSTDLSDMKVRKMWANKEIMSKNFHVNARGRVDTDIELTNVHKITAKIKVLTEQPLLFTGESDTEGVAPTQVEYEHKHQLELFKLLTETKFHTKLIDNELYELMIKYESVDGSLHYLWDVDVNNMMIAEYYGDDTFLMYVNDGVREDRQGWIYDITAKNYNFGQPQINTDGELLGYWFKNIELVYAKINWADEATVDNIEEASVEDSSELQGFNDNKGWDNLIASTMGFGYCYVVWMEENAELAQKMAVTPPYIVKNLLTKEMNLSQQQINTTKLQKADSAVKNSKMAFSITEQKESREIIEDICRQSRLTFRFRASDNTAVLDAIRNSYDSSIDFDKEIDLDNTINYNFSKTKIEDLSVGGVKISYGYNYATKKPDKKVEITLTNSLQEYKAHYGIIKEEDYKIEIDAPYISDEQSALELANYLLNYYKHQHLIVKCSVPCKDGFELEVGDILKFNTNKTAFGKSLSDTQTNIDQTIYPLFYITNINKTLSKVDIECVQLHQITGIV